jgi:hypothetical protein
VDAAFLFLPHPAGPAGVPNIKAGENANGVKLKFKCNVVTYFLIIWKCFIQLIS